MDTPPPIPPPASPTPPPAPAPAPQQQVVVVPPPKSGCGCFAGGCMSLLVMAFIGLLVLAIGGWFLCMGIVNKFTADDPADVAITMPSDAEFNAANAKLAQLKNAMQTAQATSVAFTAADLNALIARHPDFASRRNRLRIGIADSVATLEMSVPLSSTHLPGFRKRWFNGSARLRFNYDDNNFNFDPEWIEANGHQITGSFLRSFASSFSHSFTTSFEEQMTKTDASLWPRVKTITLEGDHLIITTEGEPPRT